VGSGAHKTCSGSETVQDRTKVTITDRDVVLGLGPWSLVVLKDKIAVLGPGLGLEPSVLGPVLGLAC